jgi:uncharacterized protein (DUF427 family)
MGCNGTGKEVQLMMRAVWNGVVLAEAPRTVRVEGNHYFPPDSLRKEFFVDSATKTVCLWKGLARYYTVLVDGEANLDAAWYYRNPSPLARRIKDHVAFWNGVRIEGEPEGERAGLRKRRPAWLGGR